MLLCQTRQIPWEDNAGVNSTKRSLITLAALGMTAFTASGLIQQTQSGATSVTADTGVPMVVQGLVRDVACPIQNHKSTATNFDLDCALACAKSGSPLIILTKADEIYFPMSDKMPDSSQREKLMPFVGKYVRASGTVYRRNGTRTIVIQTIVEMKDVKLQTNLGDN
jgi:hypothetical protein